MLLKASFTRIERQSLDRGSERFGNSRRRGVDAIMMVVGGMVGARAARGRLRETTKRSDSAELACVLGESATFVAAMQCSKVDELLRGSMRFAYVALGAVA